MAHRWLFLAPVAAEVLGRCALQRQATRRSRPLILEQHEPVGNWSHLLESCEKLVERLEPLRSP